MLEVSCTCVASHISDCIKAEVLDGMLAKSVSTVKRTDCLCRDGLFGLCKIGVGYSGILENLSGGARVVLVVELKTSLSSSSAMAMETTTGL